MSGNFTDDAPMEQEDNDYDHVLLCGWCGALWSDGLEYCPECGRSLIRDAVDEMSVSFGEKMRGWMAMVVDDQTPTDEYEDVVHQTYKERD